MLKEKKMVNVKKDNIVLTIGALVVVGFLLFNNNVLTGQVSKGQSYEKELHNYMSAGNIRYVGGHKVELIGVSSDGNAIIRVDNGRSQVALWGGCAPNDPGTWIVSGRLDPNRDPDVPIGVNVRVCASSFDRQEADLDFRL